MKKLIENLTKEEEDLFHRSQEIRQKLLPNIEKQIDDITSSDEYLSLIDLLVKDSASENVQKYEEFLNKSGLSSLYKQQKELEKELKDCDKKFSELYRNRMLDNENKEIEQSGLSREEFFTKLAVKEFGTTPYFYDAGYILKDGRLLNFSGEKGRHFSTRGQDHRAIGSVFADSELTGSKAMLTFMGFGNIRIIPEGPSLDICSEVEPTQKQYSKMKEFIAKQRFSNFDVDFTNTNGRVEHSISYEECPSSQQVIMDIKNFFHN